MIDNLPQIANLTELQAARVNTAGAYVRVDGLYVFVLGIRPYEGRIPVVRLGGHREAGETGWECARREVQEEASLDIEPVQPAGTYLSDGDCTDRTLQEIHWQAQDGTEPAPALVTVYRREERLLLSLMYHAHAEGEPRPSGEVKGLILLDEAHVLRLCREPLTLEAFLHSGGRALLQADFNRSRLLEPFIQLRLLARMLTCNGERSR